MFAKNGCRVASFSLRCLKLSKRFCKKKQRTDALWGWSFFANGRLGRRWHTSKLCWNVNSSNFVFYSSSFELCVHLHGTIVFDIFFINPNTKPLFIFLPFPHGHIVLTGGSRPGAPHHRRHHPKTPGGGPASPSSCTARSAPRQESPGHASVHEQPGEPPDEAGEAGRRRGWGSWGWEVTFLEDVSPRAFFCLAKAWGLDFLLSISQYCWITFFERTNTN